ncbi:DUF1799 domain-containing protein [Vibrio alginolyticus]|nr:DUF1799 domain-containing protein [Vibrio alginolyticus]
MRTLMRRRNATKRDEDSWEEELALWGVQDVKDAHDEPIEIWEEHLEVVQWWISIPGFLKFNGTACLGMDVLAVKADMELSDSTYSPEQYQKLKVIARTLAEELNQREQ